MDIKEQLPYIGTIGDNGVVVFEVDPTFDLFRRPNYKQFKDAIFNDKNDCIEILTGLSFKHLYALGFPFNSAFEIFDSLLDEAYIRKAPITSKETLFVLTLLEIYEDIEKKIKTGLMVGAISPTPDLRQFHTLSFLSWMKRNGYRIPNELPTNDKNGVLSWAEQETKKLSNDHDPQNIKDVFRQIKPELLIFHRNLVKYLDPRYGTKNGIQDMNNNDAKEFYSDGIDSGADYLKYIKEEHIFYEDRKDGTVFEKARKSDIPAMIAYNYILLEYPNFLRGGITKTLAIELFKKIN